MATSHFTYHRPRTMEEAFQLTAEFGQDCAFLAGGTELLPDYRRGREEAGHLVSLRDVPGLTEIRRDNGTLKIGAMVRLQDIVDSPEVREAFPVLASACATIGGSQVRHQGTIGGNFCRAVPCADTPPACIVGGATVCLMSANGERRLDAVEFFLGPRATALDTGEIMTAVEIPAQPADSGASYRRFALRKGQALAVAAVAARLTIDSDTITEARIALGAVAPVPLFAAECSAALAGKPVAGDVFADAARIAAEESQPISDIRGTAEYRRYLVNVLTHRALGDAAKCAAGARR